MHAWHGRWTKPQIPWFNLEKTPNTSLQYLQLGWGWRLRVCRYKVKKWRGPSTKSKTWVKSDSEFSAKSLKCILKKYPLKRLQNHKHESDAHCTATPKCPSTKSQTLGSCPLYPRKALLQNPLVQPSPVGIEEAWGGIPTI